MQWSLIYNLIFVTVTFYFYSEFLSTTIKMSVFRICYSLLETPGSSLKVDLLLQHFGWFCCHLSFKYLGLLANLIPYIIENVRFSERCEYRSR